MAGTTTAQVAASKMGLASISGSDSAIATGMPPRSPPRVSGGTVPGPKLRHRRSMATGAATATKRPGSDSGTATIAMPADCASKRTTSTPSPIGRNGTEVRISPSTVQKPNSWSCVRALIASCGPRWPTGSPATTTRIGRDRCSLCTMAQVPVTRPGVISVSTLDPSTTRIMR